MLEKPPGMPNRSRAAALSRMVIIVASLGVAIVAYFGLFGTPLVDAISRWTTVSTAQVLNLHGFMLHFGLILVIALMAATPRMPLLGLAAWLVGVTGLFLVIHIAGLSLLAWALWWAFQESTSIMDTGQVFATFAIFWALAPAIIGGAWCYRNWLPALRPSAPVVDSTKEDVLGVHQAGKT